MSLLVYLIAIFFHCCSFGPPTNWLPYSSLLFLCGPSRYYTFLSFCYQSASTTTFHTSFCISFLKSLGPRDAIWILSQVSTIFVCHSHMDRISQHQLFLLNICRTKREEVRSSRSLDLKGLPQDGRYGVFPWLRFWWVPQISTCSWSLISLKPQEPHLQSLSFCNVCLNSIRMNLSISVSVSNCDRVCDNFCLDSKLREHDCECNLWAPSMICWCAESVWPILCRGIACHLRFQIQRDRWWRIRLGRLISNGCSQSVFDISNDFLMTYHFWMLTLLLYSWRLAGSDRQIDGDSEFRLLWHLPFPPFQTYFHRLWREPICSIDLWRRYPIIV